MSLLIESHVFPIKSLFLYVKSHVLESCIQGTGGVGAHKPHSEN